MPKDEYGMVNVTVQDGENGLSAFEIAQQQGYDGTVDQWLASLKANIGAFKFVDYDGSAESDFTAGGIGTAYSGTIDGLTAGTDTTPDVILLMNNTNGTTTPTKTMMIATEDDGNSGFQFIYINDLENALPSDIGERLEDLEDGLSSVKDRETFVSETQVNLSDYELGGYYFYQLSNFPTPVLSKNSSNNPQDNCFYLYDSTAAIPSGTPPDVDFTDCKLYIEIDPSSHDYIVISYHAWCKNTSGRHFGFTDENGTAVKVYKEGSLMDQTNNNYQQKDIEIVEKLTPDMKRFYFSCFKYSTNTPNLSISYGDYRYNPNSIPVIQDVIGDKDGIRQALGSDNIYQSIFNINERRDLYRLDKFKLRNLVSRKFKRFDLDKVYGDVHLDASNYISKLPLKDLLYDGNKFLIVPREEMQMTGINLYVSPTGNGDGYTEDTPTNIADALSRCNNNTIILAPGIYYTDRLSLTDVSTTIKCIHGKAILVARRDTLNFEVDNTHSNLVVSSYTNNIATVVEKVGDEYVLLSSVNDVATCSTTPLSYYCDETDPSNKAIYVNCSDVGGLIVTQETTSRRAAVLTIDANDTNQNKQIIIENVDFVGGFHNVHVVAYIDLIMRNCKMIAPYSYYSYSEEEQKWVFNGTNCLWIQSVKTIGENNWVDGKCTSIAINCECKYAAYDGFNYHRDCAFIEIDCVSGYHGELNPGQNSQASTCHETCVGLRINGIYYDSKKACIADVNNAFTVNVNCVAFQTSNIAGGDKYAFSIAWDNNNPNDGDHRRPVMYLFGCKSFDCTDSAHVGESTNYDTDDPAIIYSAFCELDGSGDDDSVPIGTTFPIS